MACPVGQEMENQTGRGGTEKAKTMSTQVIKAKRVVTFVTPIANMLTGAGYDVSKIELSCQGAVNDGEGKEGDTKCGDVKLTEKGKGIGWKENTPIEFKAKVSTPGEFLAWHDSLAAHFKKHGNPRVTMTNILPEGLFFWLESKFKVGVAFKDKEGKVPAPKHGGNGARNGIETVTPPTVPA